MYPPCGIDEDPGRPDGCPQPATHRVAGGEPLSQTGAHRSTYCCGDHIDAARRWVAQPPARLVPAVHEMTFR